MRAVSFLPAVKKQGPLRESEIPSIPLILSKTGTMKSPANDANGRESNEEK
jgi:hypothetical protein